MNERNTMDKYNTKWISENHNSSLTSRFSNHIKDSHHTWLTITRSDCSSSLSNHVSALYHLFSSCGSYDRPDITITFTLVASNFHHWRHQSAITTSLQHHRQTRTSTQTLATPMNSQSTINAPNYAPDNAPSNHRQITTKPPD